MTESGKKSAEPEGDVSAVGNPAADNTSRYTESVSTKFNDSTLRNIDDGSNLTYATTKDAVSPGGIGVNDRIGSYLSRQMSFTDAPVLSRSFTQQGMNTALSRQFSTQRDDRTKSVFAKQKGWDLDKLSRNDTIVAFTSPMRPLPSTYDRPDDIFQYGQHTKCHEYDTPFYGRNILPYIDSQAYHNKVYYSELYPEGIPKHYGPLDTIQYVAPPIFVKHSTYRTNDVESEERKIFTKENVSGTLSVKQNIQRLYSGIPKTNYSDAEENKWLKRMNTFDRSGTSQSIIEEIQETINDTAAERETFNNIRAAKEEELNQRSYLSLLFDFQACCAPKTSEVLRIVENRNAESYTQ